MKNIFTAILFLSVAICFGQNNTAPKEDAKLIKENAIDNTSNSDYNQIFTSVQVQAQPPGGMNAFRKYIGSSFILPQVTEKTTGTVITKFVVWDDGSIKDIQIIKEIPANLGLGNEAIRVLSSSEKWTPGVYKGRYVKQYYTMPISIQITPSEKTNLSIKEVKKEEAPIVTEKASENNTAKVEKQAEPVGGIQKFYSDLASKIQVPDVSVAGVYKTKVKFVVNQDGSLSDYQVIEETPSNVGLGQNVIKYLQSIEKWNPSEQNGRKVRTYFVLPVKLNIEPEAEPVVKKKD